MYKFNLNKGNLVEIAKINLNISRCETNNQKDGLRSQFIEIQVALLDCSTSGAPQVYELQCKLPSISEGEVLLRSDFSWDTSSTLNSLGDLEEIDQPQKIIRLGNKNVIKYKHLLLLKDSRSKVDSDFVFHILKDALLIQSVNIKERIPPSFEIYAVNPRENHSHIRILTENPSHAISRTVESKLPIADQSNLSLPSYVSARSTCCVKL